ncbi:MAG TPA: hypothetical protein VGO39_09640 [Gaiellaceae bacterium]|nr:hypothetical protein [Gaiellaceae bacterium]
MRFRLRHGALVLAVLAVVSPAGAFNARESERTGACRAQVRQDVLPVWMRSGFSGSRPTAPHVVADKGTIGAVLFGWPLHSPPPPGRNNKILWVPRHDSKTTAPFWIRMQLMDGARAVGAPIRKVISTGPGPSIVDVPSTGCWRFTLSWSGRRDTLDLSYTPPN